MPVNQGEREAAQLLLPRCKLQLCRLARHVHLWVLVGAALHVLYILHVLNVLHVLYVLHSLLQLSVLHPVFLCGIHGSGIHEKDLTTRIVS